MRRFKNILFFADGSKGENSALTRAVELANANHAKLTISDTIELEQLCETVKSTHPKLRVTADIQTGNLARAAILAVLGKHHDFVIKAPECDQARRI